MITCPNCLKKHENGTKICDECGYDLLLNAKKNIEASDGHGNDATSEKLEADEKAAASEVQETDEAVESSESFNDEDAYLDINDEDDDMPYDAYRYQKKKNYRKIRRFNKTAFKRITCLSLLAIFIITSAVLILNYFFGEKKYPKYVMYVQDGALMYHGIKNDDVIDLSVDMDAIADPETYLKLCRISDKGDKLFFASDYTYGDDTVTLSYIDFGARKPEVINIGYGASAYSISNNSQKVIYLKSEGDVNRLFSYSTLWHRRVLLAEDVNLFVTSDDGASVIYYETDEALMKIKGNEKTKIADEGYVAWTADKNLYYYVFEDTEEGSYQRLYYHDGKKNTLVLKDWAEIVSYVDGYNGALVAAYTEDGTDIYYVAGGKATKLALKDADFFMANHWISEDGKKLYYLDEPDESFFSDYYDPDAIFEGLLFEMTLKKNGCKAAEEIAEDVNGGEFVDEKTFVYRKKTSDVDGTYELYHDGTLIDKNVAEVIGVDGKEVVYYKYTEDFDYQLFRNGSMIDEGVTDTVIIDGDVIYFKMSETNYDLTNIYKDKKVIAKNVYDISFYKDKKIAFCTAFNRDTGNGKVNLYENGKVTTISDDVYCYNFTLSGDIAYITDVDSTGCGDIYFYSGKKVKRVAKDVDAYYIDIVDDLGVVSEGNYIDVVNDTYN